MSIGSQNGEVMRARNRRDLNVNGGNWLAEPAEMGLDPPEMFGRDGIVAVLAEAREEVSQRLFVVGDPRAVVDHEPKLADRRKAKRQLGIGERVDAGEEWW